MNSWGGNWLQTYFEFAPGTNHKAFETKMPAFLKKHLQGDGYKYYELFYLSLRDVHANSADIGLDYLNYQKFDKKLTNLFALIALIVLVIACINFINLSTARSSERAKEVGIREIDRRFSFPACCAIFRRNSDACTNRACSRYNIGCGGVTLYQQPQPPGAKPACIQPRHLLVSFNWNNYYRFAFRHLPRYLFILFPAGKSFKRFGIGW